MKPVVAGNWKMNHGVGATREFLDTFRNPTDCEHVSVIVFPPVIALSEARSATREDGSVEFGVQNVHHEPNGAFTGEISAEMAAEAGAGYVLVGHSERRHIFGETEAETAKKVAAVHRAGLTPVLCVGETLEERNEGRLEEVIVRQLDAVVGPNGSGPAIRDGAPFLLAYEPVWAIGTGETATPEDASEAHGILRSRLAALIGSDRAEETPILYGGSAKPDNASALLSAPGVNGLLVGGASLEPDSFARIVEAAAG